MPPQGGDPSNWPPPGYWQPPPRRSGGEIFAAAVVGAMIYVAINVVVGLMVVFGLAEAIRPNTAVIAGASALALIAFGAGGALVTVRDPWARGIGMGLMIGWALTSIVTVGYCTGLNPVLYG
ncbi:hypothetical protein F0Q45_16725 [Mycobacterium simiae]|uniref:Uncharacterized protein n=1 Tax=Mycobacterium simiae TaxID=1784 RepID=A0A5B1BMS7_MYCSI|nr:hypothetical protein F0Q45_16725 [Mycobacterium simiae]